MWLAALALGLSAIGAPAWALDVSGTLSVPRNRGRRAPADAHTSYWDVWNGALLHRRTPFNAARHLAVILTRPNARAPRTNFRLVNGQLSSATLVAPVGGTLRIRNDDPFVYELGAENLSGFPFAETAPGNVRTVELPDQPGHWEVQDRSLPHVRAHLHVVADLAARAQLQRDGRFVFRNVPAGSYRLKVLDGARTAHEEGVEVGDQRELTLNPIRLSRD